MTKILTVVLTLSALALAGCASGAPLDYSARQGKPAVSVESKQMSLAEFMPQTACTNCVSGKDPAKVQVTVPVEHLTFPAFPASGREIPCRVEDVPMAFEGIEAASRAARTFVWSKETRIPLRVCTPGPDGQIECYDLTLRVGDKALPQGLTEGDTVTLRFLSDGTFFDVKEWAVAGK